MNTACLRAASRHLVLTLILSLASLAETVWAADPAATPSPVTATDAKNPAAAIAHEHRSASAPAAPLSANAAAALPYVPLEGPYDSPARAAGYAGSPLEMRISALTAKTLGEAREKWEALLIAHKPGDGPTEGYGDGIHERTVRGAQYELVRVYYLLGETVLADKLLLEIHHEDVVFRDYLPKRKAAEGPKAMNSRKQHAAP